MQLILGSQSPRRKEILGYFSIPFQQVPSNFNENDISFSGDPKVYVSTLARAKAKKLLPLYPEATILTADTIVYRKGVVYPKPKNQQEAFKILEELSGKWHCVLTSVTIRNSQQEFFETEQTQVLFNTLLPKQIRSYQNAITITDKAGAYAIQGAGSIIYKKIEGCYYNVMGLPINAVRRLLSQSGIDLWDYIN